MCLNRRINILVCPFGDLNLLTFLFELLDAKFPDKYSVTFISFMEYDKLIYSTINRDQIHISPGTREEWFDSNDLDEVCRFTLGLSRYHGILESNDYFQRVANHYGAQISKIIDSRNIDQVVLFNGRLNLFIACLDKVAERSGIPRLIFEQGLFRPLWITIDGQGVNARNSIKTSEDLHSPEPFEFQQRELYKDLLSLLPIDRDKIPDFKRKMPLFSLMRAYGSSKLRPRRDLFFRNAENEELLEAAVLSHKPKRCRQPLKTLDELRCNNDYQYILCPFQVETDTQIILHSPWISSMSQLVNVMYEVVSRLNVEGFKVKVLFKAHPMSNNAVRVSHPHAALIEDVPMPEVFRVLRPLVVTINSTAGIEAVEAGLPVITLGEAFYNLPNVILGYCDNVNSLQKLLLKFYQGEIECRPEIKLEFIQSLRSKYQVLAYQND
ncbi:Capsule polysaccharide biosynthesis protein [Gimesia chilikensis]|uniref:Capsule polysaccharide biosynthesis protein n=2 Tax=Gimesia chilikensis TaxID=2605989 RepID=A0A517WGQ8_9PLAN|nr:Capsule polysaccharide biosynthesis protein [Gimesia chilikensis]